MAGVGSGGLRDATFRHNATPDGSGDPAKKDRRAMLDEWRKQMRAKEGSGTPSTAAAGASGTPARPGSARPPSASLDDGHDKKRARMNDDGVSAGPLPLPPQQNLPPVAPPAPPAAAPVAPAQPPMAASSPSTTMGEISGGTALERFKARQALRQQREQQQQQQQMAMGYDDSSSQQHAMPPLPPAAAASAAAPMRSGICYDDDEDDHADQDYHHQDADYDNRSIASGRSHHSAGSRRGGSRSATPSRAAGTPLRSRAGRMSLIGVGAARKPSKAAGGGAGAGAGGGSRRKTMSATGKRMAASSTPTIMANNTTTNVSAAVPVPPVPGEYKVLIVACQVLHSALLLFLSCLSLRPKYHFSHHDC